MELPNYENSVPDWVGDKVTVNGICAESSNYAYCVISSLILCFRRCNYELFDMSVWALWIIILKEDKPY